MKLNAPDVIYSYRQSITTKFLPATNHRGSRIKATAQAGSVTVGWEHALTVEANHARAALALAQKFGWEQHGGAWRGGNAVDGWVWVWTEE